MILSTPRAFSAATERVSAWASFRKATVGPGLDAIGVSDVVNPTMPIRSPFFVTMV